MIHGVEVLTTIRHDNTLARPLRDYGPSDQVDVVITNPPLGQRRGRDREQLSSDFRTRETADLFLLLVMELLNDGGRAAVVLPDGTLFGRASRRGSSSALSNLQPPHDRPLPEGVFAPTRPQDERALLHQGRADGGDLSTSTHTQMVTARTPGPSRCESRSSRRRRHGGRSAETTQAWRVSIEEIVDSNYNLDLGNPTHLLRHQLTRKWRSPPTWRPSRRSSRSR